MCLNGFIGYAQRRCVQATKLCWGYFVIHSVKPRTVFVVFVSEGSFDELCDPGYPKGVLLGINPPNLLAMVRHERCFAVEILGRLM